MLIEIYCDKFVENDKPRPVIKFHEGLNVVLGDNTGSNSIGKTTFLYIIDFAFGGMSYIKSSIDTQDHIGNHTIKFAFKFNGEIFYFSRNSIESQVVSLCDEEYRSTSKISLQEYSDFLKNHYSITQDNLTFREAVSRFFRIYLKGNTNEKKPLEVAKGEPVEKSIIVLLKIFDLYSTLKTLHDIVTEANDKLTAYKNAVKYNFVQTIRTNKELQEQSKKLASLKVQRDNYVDPAELKNRTAEELEKILQLKRDLKTLRTNRNKIESSLVRIDSNIAEKRSDFTDDFSELQELFPKVNIHKISEIEFFHIEITKILKDEILQEKHILEKELYSLQCKIGQSEVELEEYDIPSGVSRKILTAFSNLQQEINSIEDQKKNYGKTQELKDSLVEYRQQYTQRVKSSLLKLQSSINDEMERLNDIVYKGGKKAPILNIEEKSYNFLTPDDSGTGTSYKSLIVFDIAILKLTNIPALIHDSIILKNIADAPLEKILNLYTQSSKQIFIAIDKVDSYTDNALKILNSTSVLSLSDNGRELFGYSWGNISMESKLLTDINK